jgi:hypothetical protein
LFFNPQFFPIPKPTSLSKNRFWGKLEPLFFLRFHLILGSYKTTVDFGGICCKVFLFQYILKDINMRILVLTLIMSFLSHSAFGAAEGASSCNRGDIPSICSMPENIESFILEYLSLKDLCCCARPTYRFFEKAANQVFSTKYGESQVVIRPPSLTTPPDEREGAEEERQR